jgi:hypothetical protein
MHLCISFSFLMRGVELGRKLRPEAGAGLFDLRFSRRRVSQQHLQLLRT